MRIGIDVGGTNTDAALMRGDEVVGWAKRPTTQDVTSGIIDVLKATLGETGVSPSEIQAVMVGTTHFTNALTEAKRLVPTASIRLAPVPQTLPPMVDWPEALKSVLGGHVYVCPGGHEYDGTPIVPFDRDRLREIAADIRGKDIQAVAVSSVFSPVNPELEDEAAEILAEELPGVIVCKSREIGRLSMLERENATIINAALTPLAARVVDGFKEAFANLDIHAPLFLSQNDGTLMSAEYCKRFPVATLASGPTNSMRGAAFLSRVRDCIVVDVGGTTSDVGVLQGGLTREAAVSVELAGVRSNFRMPDMVSIGLGGGSIVRESGDDVTVGPDSVGYELTSKALVFGGDTLTTTDVAVAAGMADIGDRSLVAHLDPGLVERALKVMHSDLARAVDRMKTSADDVPVVLVGGGSVILRPDLEGASTVDRPAMHGVANAIGAAIAQIGAEVDRLFALSGTTRDAVIAEARAEAIGKAAAAGATPDTIEIVEQEDIPLTHLPTGTAMRVRVKAVGNLNIQEIPHVAA
jgi:N-methylhydantoinase A/oxoprolinase/acetone carboxylase beta subunit